MRDFKIVAVIMTRGIICFERDHWQPFPFSNSEFSCAFPDTELLFFKQACIVVKTSTAATG